MGAISNNGISGIKLKHRIQNEKLYLRDFRYKYYADHPQSIHVVHPRAFQPQDRFLRSDGF